MEYTFDRLFESLKENEVDIVVNTGDTYHNKLTVSSEYFNVAHRFFSKLKRRYPSITILGNHDIALTNQGRMDAVTPVMAALPLDGHQIIFSKNSETLSLHGFGKFQFHHFSILGDKKSWKSGADLDRSKINIALYHGSINSSKVDSGWVSHGNRDDITIFNGFDFAMLGDIHLSQFLSDDKRIAYAGSLRQNNFGETVDKGYLIWNITTKNMFTVERVILDQKRYFFTFYIKDLSDAKSYAGMIPEGSRIRAKTLRNLEFAEEVRLKEDLIDLYKPVGDIMILPPEEDISSNSSMKLGNVDFIHENIRDYEVQKKLIVEYLKKKETDDEKIEQVIALDKIYQSCVESDVLRDVIYRPKFLKFENFLAYGKDNSIDFDKLNGIVGIFGGVGAGKSTIIDSIFFSFHNSVYREGANKNGDYINRKCKRSDLTLDVEMNGKIYSINRSIKKVFLKDKEEAKIENEVDFHLKPKNKNSSLNGETTPDTNKIIREMFGSKEDMELTSLASQFGLTSFIDARGTKRKEVFAKFFDLGVFDLKYEEALKDHKEIKRKLKDCSKDSLLKECSLLEGQIQDYSEKYEEIRSLNEEFEQKAWGTRKSIEALLSSIEKIPPLKTNATLAEIRDKVSILDQKVSSAYLQQQNPADIETLKKEYSELLDRSKKSSSKKSEIDLYERQSKSLKVIPGVKECRECNLVKDAYLAQEKKELAEQEFKSLFVDEQVLRAKKEEITLAERIISLESQLQSAVSELAEVEAFGDIRDKNNQIDSQIEDLNFELSKIRTEMKSLNSHLMNVVASKASCETKLQITKDKISLESDLSKKDEIYSLYLDSMGKNGISYWIITKKLALINKLVNQILSHAINLKFSIEDNEEEKNIKLFVTCSKKGKRPVELCSGGEKTLIAIALRAALWKICLLPKMPIFILDESLAFLDSEKLDSAIKLLSVLKRDYFEKIFLITHHDELKRVVDTSIVIDEKKGFSFVEVS
jgi:DNA repair exonuclease SbcCD ATPase subunit